MISPPPPDRGDLACQLQRPSSGLKERLVHGVPTQVHKDAFCSGGHPGLTQPRAPPIHLRAPGARLAPRAGRQVLCRADSPAAGTGLGLAGSGGWERGAGCPPATLAAWCSARGVCLSRASAGSMFTELRSKLSPPRARAGAVRTGFGERPDVDGELGWTQAQEYREQRAESGKGTGAQGEHRG